MIRFFAQSGSRDEVRTIFLIWIVTTAILWLIAYGSSTTLEESKVDVKTPPVAMKPLDVFVRWDSTQYLAIAKDGYANAKVRAFWFPLYPYLIALMPVVRYQHLMAQAISLICFLLALLVLFDVTKRRAGPQAALIAVLYMSILPGAFLFRAVYADSMFVLFILLAFRSFEDGRYPACGAFGALAAMTHWTGILLLPAFGAAAGWEALRSRRPLTPAALWIGLIAAGLGAVMLVQWQTTGDALAFWHSAARPQFVFPGSSIIRDWATFAKWDFRLGHIDFNHFLDHVAALLAVFGTVLIYRRFGFAAGTISLCLLLPGLSTERTMGMMRSTLHVFFLPIMLAEIGARRPRFNTIWIYLSGLLVSYYTICFACWYFIG